MPARRRTVITCKLYSRNVRTQDAKLACFFCVRDARRHSVWISAGIKKLESGQLSQTYQGGPCGLRI